MFPRLWTHLSGKESGHLSSSEKKKPETEITGQNVFEPFLPLFYKIFGFLAQNPLVGKREEELPVTVGPAWTPFCLQVFLFQEEPGLNKPGFPSMLGSEDSLPGSLSVSLKNLNKERTRSVKPDHLTSNPCPTAEQLDNFLNRASVSSLTKQGDHYFLFGCENHMTQNIWTMPRKVAGSG